MFSNFILFCLLHCCENVVFRPEDYIADTEKEET